MVSMDSIHRTLLALSIVHVRDDEALGVGYEVIFTKQYRNTRQLRLTGVFFVLAKGRY